MNLGHPSQHTHYHLLTFLYEIGLETLIIVPVSQASAIQRAGRAGRVRSGKVYRLFTEEAFNDLAPATVPEIQRSRMDGVILQLKALGISNVVRYVL